MSPSIDTTGTVPAAGLKHPLGGYEALGMQGTVCVIYNGLSRQAHKLSPSDMRDMHLKATCGADWCDTHYTELHPSKEEYVFNYRRLAGDIMRDCQAKGTYTDAFERRAGVWARADGGLVINNERELWTPEGDTLEHGPRDGYVYSAGGNVGFERDTPLATPEEVQRVRRTFSAIEWRYPLGAELLLGWFAIAIVSSALRCRPHLLLTGGAGIGKSTLLELMGWLLGRLAFRTTGPQTLAAYYQALNGTTRAVVLDEFEADSGKLACKATFEMSRMSYSLQDGDEGIVRGTVSGNARSYRTCAPFLAAGITPGRMDPADVTRWVVLEAVARKNGGTRMSESEAREIGPRLARLFVHRWPVFQANMKTLRACILRAGGSDRMADTVGTLLAASWTFESDTPATDEDAQVLVEMLDINERIALHQDCDEERCLEALLSKVLPFQLQEGQYLVRQNLSVGQVIAKVCEDPTGTPELVQRLAQMGIRVVCKQGVWQVYIANSPEHQELRRLFAGTKWSQGGWSTVLRRLPGGHESTQRVNLGAGTKACKVTVFDVPAELLPANDDDVKPLAA